MNRQLNPANPVLLVDDNPDILQSFASTLRTHRINNLRLCDDSRQVASILDESEIEAVLLDLNMPHVAGETLLSQITSRHPDTPVVIVTGVDEVETAVRCISAGALDYLVKPIDEGRLATAVLKCMEFREVRRENRLLREQLLGQHTDQLAAFANVVTRNSAMLDLFRYVTAVAATRQPILITGETGVGKELIARAAHELSQVPGQFVAVNVAGLDDNMFSDTLFGHAKGAFTGAEHVRPGLVERAEGGTLFLDEIGELTHASQVKLLRLLQEREYLPLGIDQARRSSARVIVATNRDLRAQMKHGDFREDLYYRLRSHHGHVPPLRERLDDLPLLVEHFLQSAADDMDISKPTPPRELIPLLRTYSFPGNVRELESMVFDAVSRHKGGVLSMASFQDTIFGESGRGAVRTPSTVPSKEANPLADMNSLPTLKELQKLLIEEALRRTENNQSLAARMIGITRQTLSRHMHLQTDD